MQIIILISAGVIFGTLAGFMYRKYISERRNREAIERSERLIKDSELKAKEVLMEAKQESFRIKQEAQREEQQKRDQLEKINERILKKEESLDQKIESTEKTKEELEERAASVKQLKQEVEEIYRLQQVELEKVAGLSKEEAKDILFKKIETDARNEIVERIGRIQEDENKQAQEKAKAILAEAIHRYAADVAVEATVTSVALPSDDMKGRIIGKEGRNINAF
mgnify:FL=1